MEVHIRYLNSGLKFRRVVSAEDANMDVFSQEVELFKMRSGCYIREILITGT